MRNVEICSVTDKGLVRSSNEDNYWTFKNKQAAVAMVADGMGGVAGGAVASATAVDVMFSEFSTHLGKKDIATLINDAMRKTHTCIRAKAAGGNGLSGMGTTCTVAALLPGKKSAQVYFGHIGDSRLYHIRAGLIVQRSVDHTMLQRILDSGMMPYPDAARFVNKNVIYKSLGGTEHVALDPVQHFDMQPGDALLLCSDGLSNHVQPKEIAALLADLEPLAQAADKLVNLANSRGGEDNITVVLMKIIEE